MQTYKIEYTDQHNQLFGIKETADHLLAYIDNDITGFRIDNAAHALECDHIGIPQDDLLWFREFLRNHSTLLIPQIVVIMKSHRANWDKVKTKLVLM